MGIISSRIDEGAVLTVTDPERFSIKSLVVKDGDGVPTLKISAQDQQASVVIAQELDRSCSPPKFVLNTAPSANPTFILCLDNALGLQFDFSLFYQKSTGEEEQSNLNFAVFSSIEEMNDSISRNLHSNSGEQKDPNVQKVPQCCSSSETAFSWQWRWKPPLGATARQTDGPFVCGFFESDQHRSQMNLLFRFVVYVQNSHHITPQRTRSEQMFYQKWQSGLHDGLAAAGSSEANAIVDHSDLESGASSETKIVNVSGPRLGADFSATDDGPLFRATMKSLEQKTGNMRLRMKKLLRKAEAVQVAQADCNKTVAELIETLREISGGSAIQPAMEHYFDKIATEILNYERTNSFHMQSMIIEPLARLYNLDIKQADSRKRDFEEESKDYYAYVSRYLGQRSDSLKEKKRNESDTKYQDKRRRFELKCFDYSAFIDDLHGGRKEQEVLSQLTKYAEVQSKSFLQTAQKISDMMPQLALLTQEVQKADRDFLSQKLEREEKRRALERLPSSGDQTEAPAAADYQAAAKMLANSKATVIVPRNEGVLPFQSETVDELMLGKAEGELPAPHEKCQGKDEHEERGQTRQPRYDSGAYRKEGLLWALSRPDSHMDIKALNKQTWHKFWIVLDQGRLSEYSNWKQRLDLHMDPIDLRMASVREARGIDRRFCFEVITPHFKRIYQAPSEEDMQHWIAATNNALQDAVENEPKSHTSVTRSGAPDGGKEKRHLGTFFSGKASSFAGVHNSGQNIAPEGPNKVAGIDGQASGLPVQRHRTLGSRPPYIGRAGLQPDNDAKQLLYLLQRHDHGNQRCADCSSESRVDWASINLAIILCIECSGIHRSLGTHISKVRSLTLDTMAFTLDIVETFLQIGNRVSNMIWEAELDTAQKLTPNSTREQRLNYITRKYAAKEFVTPIAQNTNSHFATSQELLLASVKKNDAQGVLYGLALGADPNCKDRFRNTHSVFLALAAAAPASPASSTASLTVRTIPERKVSASTTAPFAVAELLLQNGAIIPSSLPSFPLSSPALEYLEQRRGTVPHITHVPVERSPKPKDKHEDSSAFTGKLQRRVVSGIRLGKS